MAKQTFKAFFRLIGYLSSFVYPPSINKIFYSVFCLFYTGWKSRSFKSFGGTLEGVITLKGGKYISIGERTRIDKRVKFQAITGEDSVNGKVFNPSIKIGNNCFIMHDTQISSTNSVIIGDNVGIAARTLIIDAVHGNFNMKDFTYNKGLDVPDVFTENAFTRELYSKGPVIIEDNVHIAMNCVIMPGVTIGHNSVISASTIVDKDIPPYSLVSGNPCNIMSF